MVFTIVYFTWLGQNRIGLSPAGHSSSDSETILDLQHLCSPPYSTESTIYVLVREIASRSGPPRTGPGLNSHCVVLTQAMSEELRKRSRDGNEDGEVTEKDKSKKHKKHKSHKSERERSGNGRSPDQGERRDDRRRDERRRDDRRPDDRRRERSPARSGHRDDRDRERGGRDRERERERDRNGARDRRDEPKREEKQLTEEDKAQDVVLDEPIDNEEMEGLDSDGEMEDEEAKADRILEERRKAR